MDFLFPPDEFTIELFGCSKFVGLVILLLEDFQVLLILLLLVLLFLVDLVLQFFGFPFELFAVPLVYRLVVSLEVK